MLRILLLLLTLSVVAVGVLVKAAGESTGVDELLASARERVAREEPDWAGALREVGLALRRATPEERAGVLRLRVDLQRQRGENVQVVADVLRLAETGELDLDLLEAGVQAALAAGRPESVLEMLPALSAAAARSPAALFARARAHQALLDRTLDRARELLDDELDAERSQALLRRFSKAAHLPPADPRRAAVEEDLQALGSRATELVLLLGEANVHAGLSRRGFLEALEDGPRPVAVAGLVRALAIADQASEAADLGLLYGALPYVEPDTGVLLETATALESAERVAEARELLQDSNSLLSRERIEELSLEDYLRWCEALTRLGNERGILQVANLMRVRARGTPLYDIGSFYVGWIWSKADPVRPQAPQALQAFLDSGLEPTPGMRTFAWLLLARAARTAGELPDERHALGQALRAYVAAGRPSLFTEELPDALGRLAQLRLGSGGALQVAEALEWAMAVAPGRAAEWFPAWIEAGERFLKVSGRRPVDERGRPAATPPAATSPIYERWKYARAVLDRWDARTSGGVEAEPPLSLARGVVRELLLQRPDLPLVQELAARAYGAVGDLDRRTEAILQLGRLRGELTDEAIAHLDSMPDHVWTPELRRLYMRLDPVAGGLRPVLELLRASGDERLALALLEEHRADRPELRPLDVELSLRAGDFRRVLDVVEETADGDEAFGAVAGAGLLAALEMGRGSPDDPALEALLQRVATCASLTDPRLVEAADRLTSHGRLEDARELLVRLDRPRPDARDASPGPVLLRLAVAQRIAGDAGGFSDALARAEPFFSSAEPLRIALLDAVDAGSWTRARELARELLERTTTPSPVLRALLQTLAGSPASAAAQLVALGPAPLERRVEIELVLRVARLLAARGDDGATGEVTEAERRLLTGLRAERDPREALGWILGASDRYTAPWTLARLAELEPTVRTDPWAILLAGRARMALGDPRGARRDFERLARREPPHALGSAWLERVLELLGDEEELWALRVENAAVLDLAPAVAARARALAARAAGDLDGAAVELERALAELGPDASLLGELVRVQDEGGALGQACLAEVRLLAQLYPEAAAARVPAHLARLERAVAAGSLSESARWSLVEALEAQRPRDPAPVRELARLTLRGADGTPAGRRGELARRRLQRFRDRTGSAPLESLRRGEAARWLELLLARDASEALALARNELEAAPANPDAWVLLARALWETGAHEEALAELATILAIVPHPAALREQASILADRGEDPARVLSSVERIRRLEGRTEPDPELLLLRALALCRRQDAGDLDLAIELLESAWERRGELVLASSVGRVGGRLVELLARRRAAGDLDRAADLCDVLTGAEPEGLGRDALVAARLLLGAAGSL